MHRPIPDGLLQPSIRHESAPPVAAPGSRPWRLDSQLYLAFFGGLLPAIVIAARNVGRLGAPRLARQVWQLGLPMLVLLVAGVVWAHASYDASPRELRLGHRGLSIVFALLVARVQRPLDRRYQASGGEYDSLWKPGLVATLVFGVLEGLVLGTLVAVIP